jgi:hypothetical protein
MARGGSELLDKIGEDIERDAIGFAPFKTGELKAAIGHEMRGESTVRIGTGVGGHPSCGHAVYVELGTRPHEINVKNAKVLTNGASFFGRHVDHPGTAPQPYLSRALYIRRSA